MDLRQLNALIVVSEVGSFSAAARVLHTVQSNISTHIARLERDLGATLVDRSSGSLTQEGEAVVARARHIQVEVDAITADIAALRDEITGHRSEEHTSELQSLMRISYAVFCFKKKK